MICLLNFLRIYGLLQFTGVQDSQESETNLKKNRSNELECLEQYESTYWRITQVS